MVKVGAFTPMVVFTKVAGKMISNQAKGQCSKILEKYMRENG